MPKIYFHIGDHKTGTTAIQSSLANGLWGSPDAKLLYPQTGRTAGGMNHVLLAGALQRDKAQTATESYTALAKEIEASQADVVVVSTEGFENVPPAALQKAIGENMGDLARDVTVVAYVRPHVPRMVSTYAERIKLGLIHATMDEFAKRMLSEGRLLFYPRFKAWQNVFGNRFILRPMVRDGLHDGDVVADFLNLVLEGAPVTLKPATVQNEKLDLGDLAILNELQKAIGPTKGISLDARRKLVELQNNIGWNAMRIMLADPAAVSVKLQIHRALAERLVAACMEDAQALDREFFSGSPMEKDLLKAPSLAIETAQSIDLAKNFSAAEQRLIRVFIAQFAAILRLMPGKFVKQFREATSREETGETVEATAAGTSARRNAARRRTAAAPRSKKKGAAVAPRSKKEGAAVARPAGKGPKRGEGAKGKKRRADAEVE